MGFSEDSCALGLPDIVTAADRPTNREPQEYSRNMIGIHLPRSFHIPLVYLLYGSGLYQVLVNSLYRIHVSGFPRNLGSSSVGMFSSAQSRVVGLCRRLIPGRRRDFKQQCS